MNTRLNKLKQFLTQKNLDAILVTDPMHLIYFSGFVPLDISDREAYILVTKKSSYIFTSKLYADEVKHYVPDFELQQISASFSLTKAIKNILQKASLTTIGFEEHNVTFSEYQRFIKASLPFVPTTISSLRIEKDHEEIPYIAHACDIGDKAFEFILSKIKPGVTEKTLAFALEMFMRQHQAIPSFPTIVAFGKHAAIPHHVTGNQKLALHTFVLLDFGVKVHNYCSDMTRTIFIGKPTSQQRKMYRAVLEAQQYAIEYVRNRYSTSKAVKASDVDALARNHIIEQGYPSFPHSLGHGIGLQVHEAPSLSPYSQDLLRSGMVFSIEPGIYKTDEVGIRIEDLVAIENNEVKLLTKSSRELIVM